ncbi:MAG: hypothetical protein IJ156_07880 [Bacteroidales bacterium]|nr:hypothetical protein [Bacteroidales bacterium]
MKALKWIVAAAVCLLVAVSCGPKKEVRKVLVLYYSQSANTKAVAAEIASRLGADIEEIVPVEPYGGTYQDVVDRSRREREQEILPAVAPVQADIASYDLVFLGYPVWFGTYALPFASALEQMDLNGKKVVPFCSFGSGGLEASAKDLQARFPEAEVLPGYGVRAARMEAMPDEVDGFLKAGGYIEGEVLALEDFSEAHAVSEEESALFDAAVDGYPMIHARAQSVASRPIPGGTEYLFTALSIPREDIPMPDMPEMRVYVKAMEGEAPVFTRVVR